MAQCHSVPFPSTRAAATNSAEPTPGGSVQKWAESSVSVCLLVIDAAASYAKWLLVIFIQQVTAASFSLGRRVAMATPAVQISASRGHKAVFSSLTGKCHFAFYLQQ